MITATYAYDESLADEHPDMDRPVSRYLAAGLCADHGIMLTDLDHEIGRRDMYCGISLLSWLGY